VSFPIPSLDDRRFQDLVDEAKRLIPQFLPEWTNHNVSDPGVTLIELFAWMTDLTLYRLNRLPDRLYSAFLDLVGISPFPASPATVPITFWFSTVPEEVVVVPAGSEVATIGEDPIVFATLHDLVVYQPELRFALTAPATGGEPDEGRCVDVLQDLQLPNESVALFTSSPVTPGDAFYLGFRDPLGGTVLRLDVIAQVEGIGVDPLDPPLRWEIWSEEGWVRCQVQSDSTGGLNRDGQVMLLVPHGHEPLAVDGERAFWLRLLLAEALPGQSTYRTSPVLRSVAVHAIGGTVPAEHSEEIPGEYLGISTGIPGQIFRVSNAPLLPRRDGEVIQVRVDGDSSDWDEVAEFSASGSQDHHIMWDSNTGEVRFGSRIRYPDGSWRQHGAVPPAGASVWVSGYRRGGGARGNVGAGSLTTLRSAVPYVDRVSNLIPASGGVDAETIENAKIRGPLTLVSGGRAVSAADHEQLALQSSPRVARARCIPPTQPGGPTTLLIVPDPGRPAESLRIDDLALSDRLADDITAFLEPRRVLGTAIELGTPTYHGVSVAALVRVTPGRAPAGVRQRCIDRLWQFLSPVTGGPEGKGWPFGAAVTTGAIANALVDVSGVDAVDEVVLFEADLRNERRLTGAVDTIRIGDNALTLGHRLQVVAR